METIMYVRLVRSSTMRTPHARHHARQKTSANADLHPAPHVHMGIHRHAWIAEQRIDTRLPAHTSCALTTPHLITAKHTPTQRKNPATPQSVARRVERALEGWIIGWGLVLVRCLRRRTGPPGKRCRGPVQQ